MKNINKNIAIVLTGFALVLSLFIGIGNNKALACDTGCTFPAPTGSCSASVSSAETGTTITWHAYPAAGDGFFSYSWSGTDGLSGTAPNLTKSYSTTGTKTANLTITSSGKSITTQCTVLITNGNNGGNNNNDDLDGYCTARPSNPDEDERVTWTAYPEGGDGDYDYDWSGTDDLDGDDKSITQRYDDSGTKTARVRITSNDGESITRTCTVRVDNDNNDDDNDDLRASCSANASTVNVGDRVRWTVDARDGDDDYDYEWSGTDGLDGDDNDETVYQTYSTPGQKEADVRVESDGDRVTARCYVNVVAPNVYIPPQQPIVPGGIYLSSIPATGISPNVKTTLFVSGLFLWSAFLAYLFIARRNEKLREKALLDSIEG